MDFWESGKLAVGNQCIRNIFRVIRNFSKNNIEVMKNFTVFIWIYYSGL
jgi:hypothetical protein